MISKYLLLIVTLLLSSISIYCQNNIEATKGKVYYDVDSLPIFRLDSIDNELIVNYYILVKEKVSRDIQFIGGYESLSIFCDSLYFNRKDYNHEELNARALYTILFDQNFNIKEVRIIKRFAYNNLKYNYDDLVKKILFSTEGKWIKTNEDNSKWYFYLGFFNLR